MEIRVVVDGVEESVAVFLNVMGDGFLRESFAGAIEVDEIGPAIRRDEEIAIVKVAVPDFGGFEADEDVFNIVSESGRDRVGVSQELPE